MVIPLSAFLPSRASAQSVWGGTTNTSDYSANSNWSTGAAPVSGGQSASFANTGSSNVNVTTGPITPDSWTFQSNSQSYAISGQEVDFNLAGATGGIINNASAGQSISISNTVSDGEGFSNSAPAR